MESSLNEFCQVDNNVLVCGEVTIKDIASTVQLQDKHDSDSDCEEDEEGSKESDEPVTAAQAREAMQILKRYSMEQDNADELIGLVAKCATAINKTVFKNSTQKKILHYFTSIPKLDYF